MLRACVSDVSSAVVWVESTTRVPTNRWHATRTQRGCRRGDGKALFVVAGDGSVGSVAGGTRDGSSGQPLNVDRDRSKLYPTGYPLCSRVIYAYMARDRIMSWVPVCPDLTDRLRGEPM